MLVMAHVGSTADWHWAWAILSAMNGSTQSETFLESWVAFTLIIQLYFCIFVLLPLLYTYVCGAEDYTVSRCSLWFRYGSRKQNNNNKKDQIWRINIIGNLDVQTNCQPLFDYLFVYLVDFHIQAMSKVIPPDGVAEWVERLSPMLEDRGIRNSQVWIRIMQVQTLVKSN